MLDLPDELVPKKPVRLPKAMSPVSCQDLKFWMRRRSSMGGRGEAESKATERRKYGLGQERGRHICFYLNFVLQSSF